jgi:ABC-type cobalamin/Fe3+-siderophores transport system ATPase subunit
VCLNRTIRADGPPLSVLRPEVLAATFGAEMHVIEHDGRPVVVDNAALVKGRR